MVAVSLIAAHPIIALILLIVFLWFIASMGNKPTAKKPVPKPPAIRPVMPDNVIARNRYNF